MTDCATPWDRSQALIAWSQRLVAARRRIKLLPRFRGASDQRAAPNLIGLNIMVVDDSIDNGDMFAQFLGACGATVYVVRTGSDAVAMLENGTVIDVVLTDLAMPGCDGVELLRRIRAHAGRAALPVVAVSGHSEKHFATDGQQFSARLLKPVELDELAATIKHVVALHSGVERSS